jgi:chromosome segregation ATPase
MSTTESLKSFNEETKEEKLAAAKQKLKQFKKVSKQTINHLNKQDENNLRNDLYNNNNNNNSGRSSPASSKSSSFIINNQQQFQNISLDYRDQQLQLHVQTIGILVAEKAELHSKLQQTLKKCDKKQEECDELAGRLKVSRQKIIDLEKLVQQLNNNNNNSNQINHHEQQNKANHDHEMITSNENILVEELKMKLNETNDRLTSKQQEIINLNQLNTDLSSQIELLNMKLTQFSNSLSISNELEEKLVSLQVKTQTQQATINDYEFKLKLQHDSLKQEYQQYVDQLKHQIENLVDQINRLTDERETSFDKIDKLKDLLDRSNKHKESLELKLIELEDKLKQTEDKLKSSIQLQPQQQQQPQTNNNNKEQLLENEIKYFKQQIEILIRDHNNFVNLLDEKEHIIRALQTQLPDKEAQKRLLEQMHNDKQTLSRAIQQNKELKDQLVELQDAFVSLTKQNAQLTNQLDSEKFKLKQTESVVAAAAAEVPVTSVSSEWDDDSDNQENKQQNSETTLMNVIKDRLNELEKENKDLNDYITLMDENLKRTNDQQLSTINSQLNEINSLNETIIILNNNNSNEKLIQFDNNNNSNQESLILLEVSFYKFYSRDSK